MEFNGLPLHPLVVHVAVVFVPLAALAGLGYVVPRWRALLRWPMLVAALVAAATVQVSVMSGEDLKDSRGLGGPLLDQHETWANRLQVGTWVLAALVVLACWAIPRIRQRVGGGRQGGVAVLGPVLTVVLPLVAVVELYLVFRTGDAGAKSVWGG
jgi:uncharacterized membrane protein